MELPWAVRPGITCPALDEQFHGGLIGALFEASDHLVPVIREDQIDAANRVCDTETANLTNHLAKMKKRLATHR
jgi:hypothetical protein